MQQVALLDTQDGAKRRPEEPRGGARGASWRSFSPLGATLGRLGSTFLSDHVENRFLIDFVKIFIIFFHDFGIGFGIKPQDKRRPKSKEANV